MATLSTGYSPISLSGWAGADGLSSVPKKAARIRRPRAAGPPNHPIAYFWVSFLLMICGFFHWTPVYGSTLHLDMHDNLLSLKAVDADLSIVLQRLSEAAGIDFRLPRELQQKITLQLSDVRLEAGLKRILKGLSYATVYSVAVKGDTARISAVYIYGQQKGGSQANQSSGTESQPGRSIGDYEKRIKVVQERLQRVPPDSPAARRYQNEIENYQRLVERLKLQK
jgi:hypothetical protein